MFLSWYVRLVHFGFSPQIVQLAIIVISILGETEIPGKNRTKNNLVVEHAYFATFPLRDVHRSAEIRAYRSD